MPKSPIVTPGMPTPRRAGAWLAGLLLAAGMAHAAPPATPATPAPGAPAGATPAPAATSSAVQTVKPDDLLARQARKDANLVVLDVRTPQEYAEGHVPGAINIPHDQVEQRLGELAAARDKDVVVYCRSGRRAGVALGVLEKAGFKRLGHLEGDMQEWSAAGRPTAK